MLHSPQQHDPYSSESGRQKEPEDRWSARTDQDLLVGRGVSDDIGAVVRNRISKIEVLARLPVIVSIKPVRVCAITLQYSLGRRLRGEIRAVFICPRVSLTSATG